MSLIQMLNEQVLKVLLSSFINEKAVRFKTDPKSIGEARYR